MFSNIPARRAISGLALAFSLTLAQAHAGSSVDTLRQFLDGAQTLKGEFAQTVISRNKSQHSSGTLAIARPGKLRWDIQKPFPQLMVGDGEKFWIYDPELKQVTVRKLGQAIGSTPAALLAGSANLEKSFSLADGGERDGLSWVDATPKSGDANFEKVRLGFHGRELRAMELFDNFGQQTQLRFYRLETNPSLPASTFKFTPPAGVDVVGE